MDETKEGLTALQRNVQSVLSRIDDVDSSARKKGHCCPNSLINHAVVAPTAAERAVKKQELMEACRTILRCVGEEPLRQGLVGTPERFAESMLTFTEGYHANLVGTAQTNKLR